jgi:hypothetical protein
MKSLTSALLLSLLTAAAAAQGPKNVEAYSRIHHHKDGTRTESRKHGNGNEIHELTYSKENILTYKRIFLTDSKGRTRRGYILDGKQNPLGSIEFGYDSTTDQLLEERLFNKEGKLIRRLFYPGALKDPRFAKRFVAFNYDPNNPNAKPVQSQENLRPTRPVESSQDEFEPGVPIGRGAPAANQPAPAAPATPAAPASPTRRSFLPKRQP